MPRNAEELLKEDGHLSDEGVAYCAELLAHSRKQEFTGTLQTHIENCFECKKRVLSISDILMEDAKSGASKSKAGKVFSQSARFYVLRIAAILILGVGVYFILSRYVGKNTDQTNTALQVINTPHSTSDSLHIATTINSSGKLDSAKEIKKVNELSVYKPIDTTLLAENFTDNQTFDELMGSTLRASFEIKILKPSDSQKFKSGQPVEIVWETELHGPFTIILYTNLGKEVFRSEPIESKSFKIDRPLYAGLYYWKLETEDDLLHMGKILIR